MARSNPGGGTDRWGCVDVACGERTRAAIMQELAPCKATRSADSANGQQDYQRPLY